MCEVNYGNCRFKPPLDKQLTAVCLLPISPQWECEKYYEVKCFQFTL